MRKEKPIEVAIVGGGCASIAAAFELTRPELDGKYHVTIYQLGWRLGGKGASGRGPAARIEEHGLHLWMGFYENAFRLMRECYIELARDPRKCRIATWQDAFFPAPFVALTERRAPGEYATFLSYFPPGPGNPGDPLTENNPFSVTNYAIRALNLLGMMLQRVRMPDASPSRESESKPSQDFGQMRERIERLVKYGVILTTTGLTEALGALGALFAAIPSYDNGIIARLLEATLDGVRRQFQQTISSDPEMLSLWHSIDLMIACLRGIVRFNLMTDPRGFDAINEFDFREWARINGASESSVDSSLLQGAYDFAFAYEEGDYRRPAHGAGVALRGALRLLFSSRGAFFWKMRASMGDVVFAPFYEVLKRRGATFQFFHRLKNVRMGKSDNQTTHEKSYVEELEFDVQAKVIHGEYSPLFDLDGLPCWPSRPDFDQLIDGDQMRRDNWNFESQAELRTAGRKTLRVGKDFDFVVLGIGLGAVPYVCSELISRDSRWRDMVEKVKTIETQAFQIWMTSNMEELGWDGPPVCLSAFAQPFETWADMRHLIPEERWPVAPGAIAYFCSALASDGPPPMPPDPGYLRRRREQVRTNAIRFLNSDVPKIWPAAKSKSNGFRFELLVQAHDGLQSVEGERRFDTQHWTANVEPTDRYVLSVPGSQKYRISPLDNTYDNLTVAGDWTASGLDTGCVESAIISGRLAAHAICGSPVIEDIVGYDHP